MQAYAIEVKLERGRLVVKALGKTPSGRPYIKARKELAAHRIRDPKFKDEMAAAVEEILGSDE